MSTPDTTRTTDLYAAGYEQAKRDAALIIRLHAKARMTAGHVRMMASEVDALEPPDQSLRADMMELAANG